MKHNDIVKDILINEFFVLVISSPKLYRISGMTHVRSKQNVRDKVRPLQDNAGNIITQEFVMAE